VRVLYPSTGFLKVIQAKILGRILQKLPSRSYVHGSTKGRSNITNAKSHQGNKHFFTTDISGFFPYISHKMVYGMFLSNGFTNETASILTKLTTYKGQLPQGAPTSPMVANLVMIKTGDKIAKLATINDLTFTSYMDDITLSSGKCFKEKIPLIIDLLNGNGYKIAHSKTRYRTKFPVVTGIVVKNNCLDLPTAYKESVNDSSKSKPQADGLRAYIDLVLRS
jgi:RNA-directed DNA polymerase